MPNGYEVRTIIMSELHAPQTDNFNNVNKNTF